MWVRPLVDSDDSCGSKARHLGRLIAAGLPVPPGFVIETRAFASITGALALTDPETVGHVLGEAAARLETAELPAALVDAVAAAIAALGDGTLAVRSSSPVEDTRAGAAPGLFASVVDVPAAGVWTAIRAVWTSALTPIAATYTPAHAAIAIAVIVQRAVTGERVTVYTRPPGEPRGEAMWIQRGGALAKLPRTAGDDLVALALAAERAIGADAGADVELVVGPGATSWVVQARPIVQRAAPARVGPPPMMIAALVADGRAWQLDVAHNPEPLSPAQAGLVERVEQAAIAPWAMRVCAGYLYTAPAPERAVPAISLRDAADLAARAAAIDARIAGALGDARDDDDAPALADALARYLAFYRIWARELVPLIAAARAGLGAEQLVGARPSAVEATLLAAARGDLTLAAARARLGRLAPAWDVAVATFAEQPAAIDDAIARIRLALAIVPPTEQRAGIASPAVALARAGADLAERDDFHFAHAQWLVRRAILARAAALGWPTDDACWLAIDDLLAGTLDIDTVRRRAAAARAATTRASRWAMPIAIGAAPPREAIADPTRELRGVGHGGRVAGRVRRIDGRALAQVTRGDVVVVRAVTPALAVVVAGCAALVSETGGLLDHGAAMARELGIPCVVGCRDAWSRLAEGQAVSVHGDAGVVELHDAV